ncbi:MAG: hypothetical protein HRU29_05540 [Rhizobiales bacterium]|nr:hypothetical protein [Hyphomicrobiales bacterium]NRB13847.1 hypothetical protein [Hyphomicrobiales bacterium]
MSEKSTHRPTAKRSPFESGRPDRIKAALNTRGHKPSGKLMPTGGQRVPPAGATKKTNPYTENKNPNIGSKANRAKNSAIQANQRAQIGAGTKRNASDNLSEILTRQKPDGRQRKTNQKPVNNLTGSANDDIAHAAQLLEEIKSDSNKRPIFAALGFTVLWLILCVAVALSLFNSGLVEVDAVSLTSLPVILSFAAVLIIPCILSWGVAVFLWRARELHQISLSLAYTALHLTQPEDMAGESIATIGQAVRREVAAMGDGIERAIGRATTLESKFRNEVGNIQGFYKNYEHIFHKIISELEKERDLMSATGDNLEARLPKILDSLKESSFDFSKIVQSADERFTALAATADDRLTTLGVSIEDKSKQLKLGFERTVEDVVHMGRIIDGGTRNLSEVTDKLNGVGNSTVGKLEKISGNFKRQSADLGFATQAILKANEEINTSLKSRHENLSGSAEQLLQNAEQINSLLSSFASVIDKSFLNAEDRSQNMQAMLRDAAQDSADILQQEMSNIRKATSSETQKLIQLLRESSFTATTALRDDIQAIIGGSQVEVRDALDLLLKETHLMSDNLKVEATNITEVMQREMQLIKDSAVDNTEESLQKIKASHEVAIADIIGRIEQAGDKLSNTAENLNFITNRMDGEMENTRLNLVDQVAKMPIEAKQALQEMQGYIDDQVGALSDLAKTVGGFGSPVTLPESPAKRQNVSRTVEAAPIAASPLSRRDAAPTRQAPLYDAETRPQATRPAAARPQTTTRARPAPSRQATSQPAPSRQASSRQVQPTSAVAARPSATAKPQNKWEMPDLLSRASSNQSLPEHLQPRGPRTTQSAATRQNPPSEPPTHSRPPARREARGRAAPSQTRPQRAQANEELHSIESLNAISLDLAKALDHNAPDQLWARYRNGERNVFTRRLYTLRGQKLFDEVGHKYNNDSGFRRDVDRYIADFEELLTKIYEQDRDSMLIDTYLSSETGKIYLMLAHASGRLD